MGTLEQFLSEISKPVQDEQMQLAVKHGLVVIDQPQPRQNKHFATYRINPNFESALKSLLPRYTR